MMENRNALSHELATVDAELARLTGKSVETRKKTRSATPKSSLKSLPLQDLKELLGKAPEKPLSIRKEGFDLRNIKTLAKANPSLLKLGGQGAWPTLTLLK